jgi:pyruvate dehydrogenase E2 component (dihydrolipoamide acetyltransferase)
MARAEGIDLVEIVGTGPRGRIVEKDIHSYLSRAATAPHQLLDQSGFNQLDVPFERIPLTRFQRITGERMLFSVQNIPQFVLEVDVDMSEATRCRVRYNTVNGPKVSYTALLLQATAQALIHHPRVNARLDGSDVLCYLQANIGVAMATSAGLFVPVIHAAERLRLFELQAELERLKQDAEEGLLSAQRIKDGTFTISNLGMYEIDRFQAIINPPEAAILAVGRIRSIPTAVAEKIEVRPIMTLKLSADHRVVDGVTAAPFLTEVKQILENPYRLL